MRIRIRVRNTGCEITDQEVKAVDHVSPANVAKSFSEIFILVCPLPVQLNRMLLALEISLYPLLKFLCQLISQPQITMISTVPALITDTLLKKSSPVSAV
jgi:hypothetical protein